MERKADLKALAVIVDDLTKQVQDAIELGELDPIKSDKGSYTLGALTISPVQRKTWEYSSYLTTSIKQLQEQEQVEGVATQKISRSYRFSLKDD